MKLFLQQRVDQHHIKPCGLRTGCYSSSHVCEGRQASTFGNIVYHAVPSGWCLIVLKFTLQQDNDPKNTTNFVRNSLQHKKELGLLEVIVRPTEPELNVIESVWDYMKRQNDLRQPSSTSDLWLGLQNVLQMSDSISLHLPITFALCCILTNK